MQIVKFRVRGFQSFEDSGELLLREGINIIVGQNNSGKSSLLRSLQFPLKNDRHRNTMRYAGHHLAPPHNYFELSLSGAECREAFLERGQQLRVPVMHSSVSSINSSAQVAPFIDGIFNSEQIIFRLDASTSAVFSTLDFPSHRLFLQSTDEPRVTALISPLEGSSTFHGLESNDTDEMPILIYWLYQHKMFFFDAERYSIGTSVHSHATRLTPNASNLPSVLQTLAGERGSLFLRLIDHMREIFFSFGNLSIRPYPEDPTKNEVLIWPTREMDRPELGFSLESSGTGIAQVLAILTAIMTLDKCVIIIDEINSFLHPSATKALLRIISEYYGQHQYIISSHAPEVISFADNKAVFVIKRDGYTSSAKMIDLSKRDNIRDIAELIGISMSDVFGADKVIWVEGPTEELCFPYIYKELVGSMPRGLLITAATPGDFNTKRRDREIIYEVYQKLFAASSSLTETVSFSFDTEKLTNKEKERMISDSRGLIHFLPRRHFECYLISPRGIAEFINEHDKDAEAVIEESKVDATLKELAKDRRYSDNAWKGDVKDKSWLKVVDAAKLINACVSQLTNERVVFTKRLHSLFLLKYIIREEATDLEELVVYIKTIFPPH